MGWEREIREKLFERQNGKCYYCQCDCIQPLRGINQSLAPNTATLEHLRDRFHPGRGKSNKDDEEYLVMACNECNLNRGYERSKLFRRYSRMWNEKSTITQYSLGDVLTEAGIKIEDFLD